MVTKSVRTFVAKVGLRTTFALALAAFLLAGFSFAETGSAAPLAWNYTTLTVQNRIGIGTETPDTATVIDARRSDTTDTYIKSRHATKGAYFQTQSGINWAGYNMLNAAGSTATYFGYRGSTQFRIYDALAAQDRLLMDAAGTANGNIYLNPSNTGRVSIGTTGLDGSLNVNSSITGGDAITATMNATTGLSFGVHGVSMSTAGTGVAGWEFASSGLTHGVYGYVSSTDGYAVYGEGPTDGGDESLWYAAGGLFESGGGNGVMGLCNYMYCGGVVGEANSTDSVGVIADNSTTTGYGVEAWGGSTAVYGGGASSYAGYFQGNVHVQGTLSKSAGSFLIEHPLDPTKLLQHSFVESPDMKNIYDGVVTMDENGEALVELPDYFEALNMDFRYQLTPIGQFAQVYIAQEIEDNQFVIAGGVPGMKVSWQVTGIRHDDYAEANRIQVVLDKPPDWASEARLYGLNPNPKHFDVPEHIMGE